MPSCTRSSRNWMFPHMWLVAMHRPPPSRGALPSGDSSTTSLEDLRLTFSRETRLGREDTLTPPLDPCQNRSTPTDRTLFCLLNTVLLPRDVNVPCTVCFEAFLPNLAPSHLPHFIHSFGNLLEKVGPGMVSNSQLFSRAETLTRKSCAAQSARGRS